MDRAKMKRMGENPDYLANLGPKDLAAFYRRLALYIQRTVNADSLAATLLLHWLEGKGEDKDEPYVYPAKHVSGLTQVRDYLLKTARPIFLSTRPTPSGGIGGVVPRIKGTIKCDPQDGPYSMHLEGNVETPLSVQAKARMGMKVDPADLDALMGLHGFTLRSDVVVTAKFVERPNMYQVKFRTWTCRALDEYHWNPTKYLPVPNPDYGSKQKDAVRPGDEEILVYHRNALRVEKAGLAKAFHNASEPWEEKDPAVISSTFVFI